MRASMLIVLTSMLAACGGGERPEPRIEVREVRVPVPVPCQAAQRLGPAPTYPDTNEAVRSAPTIFEQVQLLLAGRALRIARGESLEEAVQACSR